MDLVAQWIEIAAAVATAISLVVAIVTYYRQKRREANLAVIDQVGFMRTQIISSHEAFATYIRSQYPGYDFPRLPLVEISSLHEAETHHRIPTLAQRHILANDQQSYVLQLAVLNGLEEFALRVEVFDSAHHPALLTLRNSLITMTEMHGYVLLYMKAAQLESYDALLRLYKVWKAAENPTPSVVALAS